MNVVGINFRILGVRKIPILGLFVLLYYCYHMHKLVFYLTW